MSAINRVYTSKKHYEQHVVLTVGRHSQHTYPTRSSAFDVHVCVIVWGNSVVRTEIQECSAKNAVIDRVKDSNKGGSEQLQGPRLHAFL